MHAAQLAPLHEGVRLPLNLGLNDGTYMPESCVEVMRTFTHRLGLRAYTTPNHDPLRDVISRVDGVTPAHIFLHNGSGPILKQVIPQVIKQSILSRPGRVARHLLSKNGYPIVTPSFTYCKVPRKAHGLGLTVHLLPLRAEDGFRFDLSLLEATLEKQDCFVYLANPNNPTGNVLATREQLVPLIERFPGSTFWVDEAYVQYVRPEHVRFSDLVPRYPNLMVGRSFSFAYGLAGVRIGYLLARPELVAEMDKQLTDYRLGALQEALAIAALEDEAHLPWLREECATQRTVIRDGLARFRGVETFDSEVNFVLCRFTDGRKGKDLVDQMKARGIALKWFEPFKDVSYEPYFRITLGTAEENAFLLGQLGEVLA